MATTTRPKAKPKPTVKISRNGRIRISSTAHRGPKPKTFRQYVAKRISRWADKRGGSTFGAAARFTSRTMRVTYRRGRKEAEGWRKRRTERANGTRPTRRQSFTGTVARGRQRFAGVTYCGGCGQSFTARGARSHVCPQNHAPGTGAAPPKAPAAPKPATAKTSKSKATAPAPTAAPTSGGPSVAQLGPNYARSKKQADARAWHRNNRAQRKQDMTVSQRAKDRIGRGWGRFTNRMAVCHTCGWTVRDGEQHDCKPGGPAQPGGNTSTPNGTTAPPQQPSGPPPAPMPVPPATPGTQAPGSQNGAPPVTAPAGNGTKPSTSPNSAPSDASAAGIVAAWSAWAQAHPIYHDEMTAKMQATRQACTQMARLVEDFQRWMVAPRPSGGGGFHPLCAQPLSIVAARFAEAGNGMTETLLAIERVYQPVLEMYRAGTPDPGSTYLSNGTSRT